MNNLQHHNQMQPSQHQSTDIPPKRRAVVDRLKRRFEIYRRRQTEVEPRFEQIFEQTCEQQSLETNLLQKRFLESKAKRVVKKTDKKQADAIAGSLQSSVHVQQNFIKRPVEEPTENLTKFSVEIVQQLEFTSAVDSQPQQISTNVTVKTLTNTSVNKNDNSGHASPVTLQGPNQQHTKNTTSSDINNSPSPHIHQQQNDLDLVGNIVNFKQEPENDFADLKLSDLIGDNTNDESETFKELISDLSDFHPDSMNLLNFDEKPMVEVKQENLQLDSLLLHSNLHAPSMIKTNVGNPLQQQFPNNYQCQQENKPLSSFNQHTNKLSPAAQTLKQMAEQHQNKNAMNGMAYERQNLHHHSRNNFNDFSNPQFVINDIGQQQLQQQLQQQQASHGKEKKLILYFNLKSSKLITFLKYQFLFNQL
jgi:hypothetical protein